MKEVKLPSGEYLLVEVDSIFFDFRIGKASVNKGHLFASCAVTSGMKWELPNPGQWSIIGKADELTEEQWKEVVDTDGWKDDGYIDYGNQWSQTHVLSATESGKSLLTHHGYELNKTIILRKD